MVHARVPEGQGVYLDGGGAEGPNFRWERGRRFGSGGIWEERGGSGWS